MFNTLSAVRSTVNATVGMMVNVQEKVQCIIWLIKSRSTVPGQCNLHHPNGRDPPVSKAIACWYKHLVEVWKSALSPGGLWTSEEDGECIRLLCECSPKKTNTQQSLQLGIPKMISQMS